MNALITSTMKLTRPLDLDKPGKNILIQGSISSDFDISIKAQNVVVLGEIATKENLSVRVENSFFNAGHR